MTSRNAPCSCGSGKRYKHCCGALPASAIPSSPKELYTDAGWFLPSFRNVAMRRFCPEPPGAGSVSRMIAPPGVLIIEGFLSAAMCEDWCAFMDAQSTQSLWVQDTDSYITSGEVKYQ